VTKAKPPQTTQVEPTAKAQITASATERKPDNAQPSQPDSTTSSPGSSKQSSSALSTSGRIGIGVGVILFLIITLLVFFVVCRKKKTSGGAYHIYMDKNGNGEGKLLTLNDYNEGVEEAERKEKSYVFVKGEEKVDDKNLLI